MSKIRVVLFLVLVTVVCALGVLFSEQAQAIETPLAELPPAEKDCITKDMPTMLILHLTDGCMDGRKEVPLN